MTDEPISVFDTDEALIINTARLDNLKSLNFNFRKKRVLDLGCGVGHLARFFVEREANVLCIDGRKENIDSLIKRYKDLKYAVSDVENDDLGKFGFFDIIFCYGLLYHLEKIEYVVNNMSKICRELLLLETCICDSSQVEVKYVQDSKSANQGLRERGSRPSPAYLVSLLKRSGFSYIYTPKRVPNHPDFKFNYKNDGLIYRDNHLLRQVFIASKYKLFNNKLKFLKNGFEFYDKSLLAKLPFPLLKYYSEYIYKPKKLTVYPDWHIGSTLDNLEKPRKKYITTWDLLGRKSNKKFTVNIKWYKNLKLKIPYLSELASCLYIEGLYEPNEFCLLNSFLKKRMVFIDVGAHLGLYTLFASRKVEDEGLVVAFEPSLREFSVLEEHLKINRIKNVKVLRMALSNCNSTLNLNIAEKPYDGHNTFGSFRYKGVKLNHQERVKTTMFDKVIDKFKLSRVDVIKIDVEGFENLVLKGAYKTIKKFKPLILVEIFDGLNSKQNISRQIKQMLKSLLYSIFEFDQEGSLVKSVRRKYIQSQNIIAIPEGKILDFQTIIKKDEKQKKNINRKFPLVSIITTCYNSGKYLEDCIKSVLCQDYPYIEHIIQDGGSTDNTLEILKKYKKKSLKIYSEPDNGQTDGLNKAIQKVKGDILLVLNADDMLMPYAVSWGVENLKKFPKVGAIYGDTYIIDESGEIIDIYKAGDYDFEKVLCVEVVPPAQAAFIRRSALEKVGFWADKSLDTCPDYEMWVRLIQKFPLKHIIGVITKYRHYKKLQLDSKLPRMTKRFIRTKRQVMDKLFNSPNVSDEIKRHKRRAYASLDIWASETAFNLRQPREGVYYLLRGFIRRPTYIIFIRIIHVIKLFIYLAFRRIIDFLKIRYEFFKSTYRKG